MDFNPLMILWIVAALFCIGFFIYIRRRRQLAAQARYRQENAHRPPLTNHHAINMPSTSGAGQGRYYGQEYPTTGYYPPPPASSSDQPPPFKAEEEITLPPPAYNEHKNDVRLPPTS